MYLAAVPLTSYLCQANGTVEKIVNGVLNLLSSTTGSTIPSGRVIPAISAMVSATDSLLGLLPKALTNLPF